MIGEATELGQVFDQDSYDYLLSHTGENCSPSEESVAKLKAADLVLMSGQFVGAGKSTLISSLQANGRFNIASWTNRDLRPGEVEGVDKCHRPLVEMAGAAEWGYFLELEEVRPQVFYASPAEFQAERGYVKDLELKGAMRLR